MKLNKKTAVWAVLIALWLLVVAAVIVLTATKAADAKPRRTPVYAVARDDNKIALTFNAAWGDETTDEVLEILDRYGVRATFFFVGTFAREYPESVKKIANAGHEIANHSMRHFDPTKMDEGQLRADMEECSALLQRLTGVRPALYRAPSGAYDNKTVETAEDLGMAAVQWSADSVDWKDPSPDTIVARVRGRLASGGIVLLHLGKQNTARALPRLIEALLSDGFVPVTVGELLLPGDTYTDRAGIQRIRTET